jgi:cytochrome c oxidase subunit 2
VHIHRFEKIWLAVALLFILGLISSVVYGAIGPGIEMVDAEGGTVDPQNLEDTKFADPGVEKVGENEYAVYVVAKQFSFDPGTPANDVIRVPANSRVTFYVTSSDVVHGFEVVGTNLNTMAIPGQVSKVTVEFGDPATYGIVCNEYCGAAHHGMEGRIVVVPESDYDRPGTNASGSATNETANATDESATATDPPGVVTTPAEHVTTPGVVTTPAEHVTTDGLDPGVRAIQPTRSRTVGTPRAIGTPSEVVA